MVQRIPLGTTLELRYEHPAVCDTWIGTVVERLNPSWVVRILVLDDPLDEFQSEATILSSDRKLQEWMVLRPAVRR